MNIKKEIYQACEPPEPKNRDSFLSALPYPKLTYPEFVLYQISYISKRVWLASLTILLAGVGTVCIIPDGSMTLVWVISALIPLLAMLTASEISRSDIFGMAEIEAGCRFALPQVIGARMIILGICNFALISAAAVISGILSPFGIAKSALYILTPFVLVNGISLAVFGRVKGQDGVYLSAAAAFAVSLAGMILYGKDFYNESLADFFMTAVCGLGIILTAVQSKKILTGKDNYYGIKD